MNLEDIYNTNMQYLKQHWPTVYENLLKADISNYELSIEKDGEINVTINGHKLYPNNVDQAISNQVDTFLQNPTSYYRKPSWCYDTNKDYYHDKFITDIERSSPYIAENKHFSGYSHNLDGFIPILILFGIGTGKHIEKLLKKLDDVNNFIIIDENYEFLKISMHLIDWRAIFKFFTHNHRSLHFIIHNNPQENAHSLLNTIFANFPYYFFNVYFISHYESNFFNNVKKILLDKINLGITGLGFYDDEKIGLEHTIENLSNDIPLFKYTNNLPNDSSAFIVGSGPSIDKDIEIIKQLQDKVVIFSCGTSLKVLYENNIIPDYHIEQERPPDQCDRVVDNFPKEYLKKINIIGLNVVSPKMFELFKSSKIFFRENDAGGSMAPNIIQLDHCNPTVVNATCSFASEIGFDNIFLFGADMGYRDAENHHSKSSDYYKGSLTAWKPNTIGQQYPANFNNQEMLYTTEIFLWCKQRIENCIYEYNIKDKKSINYYNCSDGLYIERCVPLHSNKIQLNPNVKKDQILQGIENSFDKDFQTIHEELHDNFLKQQEIVNDDIRSLRKLIKSKKVTSFSQFFTLVSRCYTIANHLSDGDKSFISRSMLRGTTFHFIASVFTHALACSSKDDAIQYINESLEKYLEFLDLIEKELNYFKTQLLK